MTRSAINEKITSHKKKHWNHTESVRTRLISMLFLVTSYFFVNCTTLSCDSWLIISIDGQLTLREFVDFFFRNKETLSYIEKPGSLLLSSNRPFCQGKTRIFLNSFWMKWIPLGNPKMFFYCFDRWLKREHLIRTFCYGKPELFWKLCYYLFDGFPLLILFEIPAVETKKCIFMTRGKARILFFAEKIEKPVWSAKYIF